MVIWVVCRWAQELCGAGILKPEEMTASMPPEEMHQMNIAMMQQQELIADFVMRVRKQAVDLSAFK